MRDGRGARRGLRMGRDGGGGAGGYMYGFSGKDGWVSSTHSDNN